MLDAVKGHSCFYLALCCELLFSPFWYMYNFLNRGKEKMGYRNRSNIQSPIIYVETHEWAGYSFVRKKTLKNGLRFSCGIEFQLERFRLERLNSIHEIDYTVTISDLEKYPMYDIISIKKRCNRILNVSNVGLDFSGYAAFFDTIKNKANSYVILSNSSVNARMDIFLDDYIEYMENNLDVGMLGISYSTKVYQTLIRNNFNPHLQSFFLLTTIDVLKEVVEVNGGHFPGKNISDKRLLIREGEVGLSKLVLSLGYNLAVVYPETGVPFKFKSKSEWDKPLGDVRLTVGHPNRITPIQK